MDFELANRAAVDTWIKGALVDSKTHNYKVLNTVDSLDSGPGHPCIEATSIMSPKYAA